MKYVVIFAPDFEAARAYALDKNLQRGWWTFAHSIERIKHLSQKSCEPVYLTGWTRNAGAVEANTVWLERRTKTA